MVVIGELKESDIPYEILGGFALVLRDSQRKTLDVDIAVATNMATLREAFEEDDMYLVPRISDDTVMNLFVNLGTSACPTYVKVDLKIAGKLYSGNINESP